MMHYLEAVIEFLHLFCSSLVEVTTPGSRTFPMAAAAPEAQIPVHSLLIPLLQDLGRGKPLQSFQAHPLPVQNNSQNLGKMQQMWSPTGVRHIPAAGEEKNHSGFARVDGTTRPASDGSRFHFAPPLSQPSRELPRQNSTEVTGIICLWWFSFFKDKNKSKHLA